MHMRAFWVALGLGTTLLTLLTRRKPSRDADDGESSQESKDDIGAKRPKAVATKANETETSHEPPSSPMILALPKMAHIPPLSTRFGDLIPQRAWETVGGGIVRLVTCPLTGFHYRLKRFCFDTPTSLQVRVATEIAPTSPHLLGAIGCWINRMGYHLLSPVPSGGKLASYFPTEEESTVPVARFVIAQLISGIHLLHSNEIALRAMTLENVVVDSEGFVQIGDFGHVLLCADATREYPQPADTSPLYSAPELAVGRKGGMPADIWALGILLYRILSGRFPFPDLTDDPRATKQWIIGFMWRVRGIVESNTALMDLFTRIFQVDPAYRITAEQLPRHPFFKGVHWEGLAGKTLESPLLSKVWENRVVPEPPEELFLQPRGRIGRVAKVLFAEDEEQ